MKAVLVQVLNAAVDEKTCDHEASYAAFLERDPELVPSHSRVIPPRTGVSLPSCQSPQEEVVIKAAPPSTVEDPGASCAEARI